MDQTTTWWRALGFMLICGSLAFGQADPVGYPADTSPEDNVPAFTQLPGSGGTASVSQGVLTVTASTGTYRFYTRYDPLEPTDSAVMRFRMKVVSSTEECSLQAGFLDGAKVVQVGFTTGAAGFTDLYGDFISGAGCDGSGSVATNDDFHIYEIEKQGEATVRLLRDGLEIASLDYGCLSDLADPSRQAFGAGLTAAVSESEWDYVVYQIGSAAIEQNPPEVFSTDPTSGSSVGAIHEVIATFDESMHETTISPDTFLLEGAVHGVVVPESVTYDNATSIAIFVLTHSLPGDGETYTITLVGTGNAPMADLALNTLDGDGDAIAGGDYVSTFTVNNAETDGGATGTGRANQGDEFTLVDG